MDFVRVWVSTFWVWFFKGCVCQFLAKKGESCIIQMLFSLRSNRMLNKMSYSSLVFLSASVSCNLSYEHNCVLCSKLHMRNN